MPVRSQETERAPNEMAVLLAAFNGRHHSFPYGFVTDSFRKNDENLIHHDDHGKYNQSMMSTPVHASTIAHLSPSSFSVLSNQSFIISFTEVCFRTELIRAVPKNAGIKVCCRKYVNCSLR
jgi:hypothetical protein